MEMGGFLMLMDVCTKVSFKMVYARDKVENSLQMGMSILENSNKIKYWVMGHTSIMMVENMKGS
jgi:polyferredoxin